MDNKRILIVDDNPLLTEMYDVAFGAQGIFTEAIHDGNYAVEKAKEMKPDLILLDLKMTPIDGGSVLRALKKDVETENIGVVIFTSVIEESSKVEAKKLGAIGYVIKSDEYPSKIVEEVKEFL